ncbi:unnamed protein product [Ceratitis capitata]|uniref:(Mediterranean fruit fly) hypothetical protein n=1 Tax=Ceratitis capitata TaxID=7213 RepID=A0A811U8K9_CERCA|nr:unnamed protein product [Ceratitis capitata]
MQAFNNSNNSNNVAWERSQRMLAKWSGVGHTGSRSARDGVEIGRSIAWSIEALAPTHFRLCCWA